MTVSTSAKADPEQPAEVGQQRAGYLPFSLGGPWTAAFSSGERELPTEVV